MRDGALVTSAQRDLQAARIHLGHVRMIEQDAGRAATVRPLLEQASQGVAAATRALDDATRLSAQDGPDVSALRVRAETASHNLTAAELMRPDRATRTPGGHHLSLATTHGLRTFVSEVSSHLTWGLSPLKPNSNLG